jgi:hypothetical protein
MRDPNISWCPACKTVYDAQLPGGISADNSAHEPSILAACIAFTLFGCVASVAVSCFMGFDPRIGIRDFIEQAGPFRLLICMIAGISAGGTAVSIYSSTFTVSTGTVPGQMGAKEPFRDRCPSLQ